MHAGLLFFAFLGFAAYAADSTDSAPVPDSTALVHEASPPKIAPTKTKPPPRRATLDPDVAVPQAGAGVAVRRQKATTDNDERNLLRLSSLDADVPPITAATGGAGPVPFIRDSLPSAVRPEPGKTAAEQPAEKSLSPDERIAAANEHLASAEENLHRHFPDFDAALSDLNEAVVLMPNHPRAYSLMAALYDRKGDYAKAEDSATVALRFYSKNALAEESLAMAQLLQGRVKEAEQSAPAAVAADSARAASRYVHALTLDAQGRRKEALEELKAAASIDPARFQDRSLEAFKGGRIFGGSEDMGFLTGAAPVGPPGTTLPWTAAVVAAAVLLLGAAGVRRWTRTRKAPTSGWRKTAPAAVPDALLAGRYEMGRLIARGGWGEVYEGFDRTLKRQVAIKKMPDELAVAEQQGRAALLRQTRNAAALKHSGIVEIYEILERGFELYAVSELVSGKTLEQILIERRRLSLAHAFQILHSVCGALSYAHARAVVHRDLKPANIIITEQGHVKIMDFGIARSLGEQGPEADVFALGCCLYEILSGSAPYSAASTPADKLSKRYAALGSRIPGLPGGIDPLIAQALEPVVEKRIRTPEQFLARLEPLARSAAVATSPRAG